MTPDVRGYIPRGDIARAVARTLIERTVRENMERGNLTVSLGDMLTDGTVPLTVTAQPEAFDPRTYIDDIVCIRGYAWIEDRASQPIHVWYSFDAQDHTNEESNYADHPPVDFWTRYGREEGESDTHLPQRGTIRRDCEPNRVAAD